MRNYLLWPNKEERKRFFFLEIYGKRVGVIEDKGCLKVPPPVLDRVSLQLRPYVIILGGITELFRPGFSKTWVLL